MCEGETQLPLPYLQGWRWDDDSWGWGEGFNRILEGAFSNEISTSLSTAPMSIPQPFD